MSVHEAAFRANVGECDRDFIQPEHGLPRCDICDIYIGYDMSNVHEIHPEHLIRLAAQQGYFSP